MTVYFLRPIGMEGPVKIGCSGIAEDRLATYQPWSPFPLEIAASLPGDYRLERRFHERFKAHHTHHEWFAAAPEITACIAAINAGTFDPETLPEMYGHPLPRRLGCRGPGRRALREARADITRLNLWWLVPDAVRAANSRARKTDADAANVAHLLQAAITRPEQADAA